MEITRFHFFQIDPGEHLAMDYQQDAISGKRLGKKAALSFSCDYLLHRVFHTLKPLQFLDALHNCGLIHSDVKIAQSASQPPTNSRRTGMRKQQQQGEGT
jgi:hypothetical protein